ncbi:hypothetical protein GCM10011348_01870 [Marinobacterium nitratireducens]|uniref:Uncharacterized protein n=1 Tax=Marinobacterium nitratireducens TaxID=518897 RepID=A0A917Z768_9GAMM|nr:DUF6489 family protein [Marinobacterium nitratireducens]GGO75915.1 hypothetical protein GCM10011348_01870 [Marinobacterium nitratireducens]
MNFKIDIEMTPEEFRRALGLPDVASLQDEMLAKVRERMLAGVEGYDPMALFKQQLTGGMGSLDSLQQMMMAMLSSYQGSQSGSKAKGTDKK